MLKSFEDCSFTNSRSIQTVLVLGLLGGTMGCESATPSTVHQHQKTNKPFATRVKPKPKEVSKVVKTSKKVSLSASMRLCALSEIWQSIPKDKTDAMLIDRASMQKGTNMLPDERLPEGRLCTDFSTPQCLKGSDKNDMACFCTVSKKHLNAKNIQNVEGKGLSKPDEMFWLFLWSRGRTQPIHVPVMPKSTGADVFSVARHDLDGDGKQEWLIAQEGVYNSIGTRWTHVWIVDGTLKRPVQFFESYQTSTLNFDQKYIQSFVETETCEDATCDGWKDLIAQSFIQNPDNTKQCMASTYDLCTCGNSCNGCTAGGPTHGDLNLLSYSKGKLSTYKTFRLWGDAKHKE